MKHLSKECHCTSEINALRTNLQMKIANIPICSYRDEVTALKAQIELVANQVNVHDAQFSSTNFEDQITKLCQDLERQQTIMNSQVIGSTTNIDLQNLQERVDALTTCLDNLKNQVNTQDSHIDTINERPHDNSRILLKICQVITDTVNHAEIRLHTNVNKLNSNLYNEVDKKLEALEEKLISKIAKAFVQPGRTPDT